MARTGHNGHGNGHRQHATETPDVSHIKNVDVTHEASDVSVGGILKFVVGLTIFGVIVYVLMWGMFWFLNSQERKSEPQPGPMAMTEVERRPPDPKLQAAPGFGVKLENGEWVPLEKREPEAEYRVLRHQWELVLKEGARDQSGNVVGIPIDEAIDRLIHTGVPSRVKQTGGIETPTAASSGREGENRNSGDRIQKSEVKQTPVSEHEH